ncbi:hypothetical protein DFH27DRAFT_63208 [Peziza echinospora]|nr:hypothetical protein DFH27DRAFT_63208 [Peziza echinospora]
MIDIDRPGTFHDYIYPINYLLKIFLYRTGISNAIKLITMKLPLPVCILLPLPSIFLLGVHYQMKKTREGTRTASKRAWYS